MKLTTENIKTITLGAIRIFEEDGYTVFRRFTPYQEKVLEERKFTPRQFASSGMKLSFTCGEGIVHFEYLVRPGAGAVCHGIDVLCDGIEVFHHYSDEANKCGQVFFRVPKKEKPCTVTVFFPNLAGIGIRELNVPDDYAPAKRERKILMLGDSITHGYHSFRQHQSYANVLGERLNAEILNQGIGGDKFHAPNIDPELPFTPDIITVAYGTNDWAGAIPQLDEKIDEYFKKLRTVYPAVPVFAIPPIWRGNIDGIRKDGRTLEDVRLLVKEKAEKYGCFAVDSAKLVPPSPDYFMDKFLHPNDVGFILYGINLADEIKKTLNI
ncbi:MAG: SGNH/GDSL hydrolase family protein [Clostridia bacterium]|nr:SGNH/GDSL hydrolase family protein [Clostridia bacterium]